MGDSIIKDLGATFLVGAFAILSIQFVCWRLAASDLMTLLLGPSNPLGRELDGGLPDVPSLRVAAFVAVAFAVGIVVEDVSGKYMDSGELPYINIVDKDELRFSVLVKPASSASNQISLRLTKSRDTVIQYCPSPLGRELGTEKAFSRFARTDRTFAAVVDSVLATACNPKQSRHQFQSNNEIDAWDQTLRSVYYLAKNYVYRSDNYFNELQQIRIRNDFSRSILLLSLMNLILIILLAFVAVGKKVKLCWLVFG